jgi:hypothetical protein
MVDPRDTQSLRDSGLERCVEIDGSTVGVGKYWYSEGQSIYKVFAGRKCLIAHPPPLASFWPSLNRRRSTESY